MRTKKYIVFLSVLLVMFGSGLSCGKKTTPNPNDPNNSGGTTVKKGVDVNSTNSLVIWGVFDSSEIWQPIIRDFTKQKEYINTKITYVLKNYSDYESLLVDAIASDEGPDIYYISNAWLGKHKAKMYPASSDVMSADLFKQKFFPAAYDDFVSDGNVYALPLYSDSLALFYNTRMFGAALINDPPATWDDVIANTQTLTHPINSYDSKGRLYDTINTQAEAGIALGTTNNISRSSDILLALMLQTGTQINSTDKRTFAFNQFRKQVGVEELKYPGRNALEFYTAFGANNDKNRWSASFPNNIEAFAKGRVAMIVGYSYMIPQIQKINPDLSFKIAPLPQIKGAPESITLANYWGWAVSRNSKNQNLAWNFMSFVADEDNLSRYLTSTSKPSPLLKMVGGSNRVFEDQKKFAKTVYKGNGEVFDKIFIDMIDSVVKQGQSAQSALDNAVTQGNDMLKKYY